MTPEFSTDEKNTIELYASEFFQDEALTSLFMDLFKLMRAFAPEIIIRGKKGEIIGASYNGEKYLFYVVHSGSTFSIKFKSKEKEDFDSDNAEKMRLFATEELLKHKEDPIAYLLGIQKYERTHQILESELTERKESDRQKKQSYQTTGYQDFNSISSSWII